MAAVMTRHLQTGGQGTDLVRTALRYGQRIFLLFGLCAVGCWVFALVEARWTQASLSRSLDRVRMQTPARSQHAVARRFPIHENSLVGRIDIARIGLSEMVLEGDGAPTLSEGVGHVPGTALPGESGNVGLAGHRDTFFRALRNIRDDDRIVVTTPQGCYRYRVVSSEIVNPYETRVLNASAVPSLTLVTCYPF